MQSSSLVLVLLSLSLSCLVSTYTIRDANFTPRPIQIAQPKNHSFEFELNDLRAVLEADNIKEREVVIVSVAGAFRKGKSFLLNFFLRYLYAQYENQDVSDWINDGTELQGFHWKGGRRPVTSGIVMWSDIFTHDYENGDKIAIILLDTQGTFDSQSTLQESTTVFALSTLLSSVQCYNVMQNIQEDDLQNLQLFVEYARLALEQSDEKPFQNLIFLVRDWPSQDEIDYGWNGQQVIDESLAEHPTYQDADMLQLRKQIRSSFANISAYLMPYPGRTVANGLFTGNMDEIDTDFKTHLRILTPSLFAPENLIVKEINGQKVRAHELVHYIEKYTTLFSGKTLPEPKTVLQATAEVSNMILFNNSLHEYLHSMGRYFNNDFGKGTYYYPTMIDTLHWDAKQIAMSQFQSKRKLGSIEVVSSFERRLNDAIELKFKDFQAINERTRMALIENARIHNEECINRIEQNHRQKMMAQANGVPDDYLIITFSQTKQSALQEFEASKVGDDLGDDKFSVNFKKRLERKLETFWPTLERINRMERQARERNWQERERNWQEQERGRQQQERTEKLGTMAITGGGAAVGAALGALIGGPPGAAFGLIFGAFFGYKASL